MNKTAIYRGFLEGFVEEMEKRAETVSSVLKLDHLHDTLRRAQERVRKIVPDLEQEASGKDFHVTLTYAKDVKPNLVKETAARMRQAIQEVGPIEVALNGVESFENPKGEGVVVFKIDHKGLDKLHHRLKAINQESGGVFTFPTYRPHATIGYTPKPLSAQQKKQLAAIAPHPIVANPTKVDITQKNGDAWKLIHQVKTAVAQHFTERQSRLVALQEWAKKFAEEIRQAKQAEMGFAVTDIGSTGVPCQSCGYVNTTNNEDALSELVTSDANRVHYDGQDFGTACPMCGTLPGESG
jgi:2'-5' RNA ligase